MTDTTPTHTIAPESTVKPEDVIEVLRQCYDPEIPVNIVDVREDWEWNKDHVPGARHVVLNSVLANPAAAKFRDKTIFVCMTGERSSVASEMAVALGIKDVVNFRGGTKAWKDASLPLEMP